MDYSVKLDFFEGPFDLLCHLVQKNEIDIRQVPIGQIIDEYLAVVRSWQSLDLELATEFVVMAANLLVIKSRTLLPPPVDEEEAEGESALMISSEEELIERMEAYRRIKSAAAFLKDKEQDRGRYYLRSGGDVWDYPPPQRELDLGEISFAHLVGAMQELWHKAAAKEINLAFNQGKSIREKILEIHDALRGREGRATLRQLLLPPVNRAEVVVTFIALLEMARWQAISFRQEGPDTELIVFYLGDEKQGC